MKRQTAEVTDMQIEPEITVDDLRKLLIMTIRDDVLNARIKMDLESLADRVDREDLFARLCRNLDYFQIQYDADEMWSQFTSIVGDCAEIALTQIETQEGGVSRQDLNLKAA